MHNALMLAYRLLYYTYGILFIVVGLDKFFSFIAYWDMYLNNAVPLFLHISPATFLYGWGVLEILTGLLLLWRPEIGGYVAALLLVLIAINLFSIRYVWEGFVMTYYDIAFRDLAMAIGAYTLAVLSQHGHEQTKRKRME